ncbi:ArsR/SmtB family transcription factor [Spirosoma validum]|uniref:Helix-turn-helix transcriptional regulator n=1 Tax=Spirosoma validum TaxID=2771355 RepID=A0A927B1I8_9BACT|nr:metalloregulator ArsR/SmtB family transcription factor [Spirosoma validum]MBD2753690.1 helix-turn-helix transcriptional regulator [Spirosoma validum]
MQNNAIDAANNLAPQTSGRQTSSSTSSTPPLSAAEYQTFNQAAELLKTLAHPLRIRIVLTLAQKRSMNVSALQRQLKVDQAILSYQLTKMRDRGLLTSVRQGQEIHYSLTNTMPSEIMLLLLAGNVA